MEKRRTDSIEREIEGQSKNIGVEYKGESAMFLSVKRSDLRTARLLTGYINSNLPNLLSFVLTCAHKMCLFFYVY